jgi:uncharacterized protein YabN with tetrapyrrole methylase and pyrophosphatase domain
MKRSKQNRGSRKEYKKFKKEVWEWYREIKSHNHCAECGEDHPSCLEFHHLERDDKHGNISSMIYEGRTRKEIKEEISKCIILCANCHRKLHWIETHEEE